MTRHHSVDRLVWLRLNGIRFFTATRSGIGGHRRASLTASESTPGSAVEPFVDEGFRYSFVGYLEIVYSGP